MRKPRRRIAFVDPLEGSAYREKMSWARRCLEQALEELGKISRKRRISSALKKEARTISGAIEEIRRIQRLIPRFDYSDASLGLSTVEFVKSSINQHLVAATSELKASLAMIENNRDILAMKAPDAINKIHYLIRFLGSVGDNPPIKNVSEEDHLK